MSDDRNSRGPADAARVNVNEDYEVRYWTKKWGVTEDELRAAVAEMGPMVADVEAMLKKKHGH